MVSNSGDGGNWRNGIATKLGVVIALAIAVAAIGWGWNYGLRQERTFEQEARQAHADQAKNGCYQISRTDVQMPSVKEANGKPCAPSEKAKQKNDNRRDYANLVAQRSSALWAKIMGIAALIGMGLSLVGVVLVWTTFRETRKANEIAREIGEAQVRAYLSLDVFWEGYGDPNVLNFKYSIHNSGQSPARNVAIEIFCVDQNKNEIGLKSWRLHGNLKSGGSIENEAIGIDISWIGKFDSSAMFLPLCFRLVYVDVFDKSIAKPSHQTLLGNLKLGAVLQPI